MKAWYGPVAVVAGVALLVIGAVQSPPCTQVANDLLVCQTGWMHGLDPLWFAVVLMGLLLTGYWLAVRWDPN